MKKFLIALSVSFIVACGGSTSGSNSLIPETDAGSGNGGSSGGGVPTSAPIVTQPPIMTAPDPIIPLPTATPIAVVTPPVVVEVAEISTVKLAAKASSASNLFPFLDITSNSQIDIASVEHDKVNIVANVGSSGQVGSVHFRLEGPLTINRIENSPPYTLVGDTVNIDIRNGGFPVGEYVLTVTPYLLPDNKGDVGTVKTLVFSVIDSGGMAPVDTVPRILGLNLLRFDAASEDYFDGGQVANGGQIDLADYINEAINFEAISADHSKTGSVHFELTGPIETIDRSENNYIYTLQRESDNNGEPLNFKLANNDLPVGEYSLRITPYSLPNKAGESGTVFVFHFDVVDSRPAVTPSPIPSATPEPGEPTATPSPTPEPTATPVVGAQLKVADDSYVVSADQAYESELLRGVGANDTYLIGDGIFSVVVEPINGDVNMDIDGSFTYTPTPGFVGVDSFTYELKQGAEAKTALATIRVVGEGDTSGFTGMVPSADSKIIYVSSSEGNDSNSCLTKSEPCKTIGEGIEKMRSGYPDHMYLKRGDTWRGETLSEAPSGRSKTEPAVIAYYGAANSPRPVLERDDVIYKQDNKAISHLHFIGLHIYAYKKDPKHAEFDPSSKSSNMRFIGAIDDVLIEDCIFDYGALQIQQWDGKRPSNFRIRRNIFKGVYDNESSYTRSAKPSAVFTYGVDGQHYEENVFDYGGWHPTVKGAGANMLSHNLYLQNESDGNKTIFRNNISVRAASHGIQMRSGGLAEDNFFGRNAIGILVGYDYAGREVPAGTQAYAINNVISEGQSMYKGVDHCSEGSNLCSSAMWGLNMMINSAADVQAHGNIVSMLYPEPENRDKLSHVSLNYGFKNGFTDFPNTNNIAYAWGDNDKASLAAPSNYADPTRTLGSYNAMLRAANNETLAAGKDDFDAFMDVAKSRPLGMWDERYTAKAINAYIREGFIRN